MREWNPKEMKGLFEEKAKKEGRSLRDYIIEFVSELSEPIHYTTMVRYFKEGSKGPKGSKVKIALYEKIEKDLGYSMFIERADENEDNEIFIEDREKKLPEFCQKKLEEAFTNILRYLVDAYNGQYTLLFENDYSMLLYYFEIYKPCAPNYLCREIQEFFKNKLRAIKEEAINSGMIIFEDIGFCYQDELEEGETADVGDCELAEDYIENNLEEHRERVRNLLFDIADFWSENVERLYPKGEGEAKQVRERFEEYCKKEM